MTATKLLQGFAILLLLQWLSTVIISLLEIPFPPPLLGMLILTALLCTGIIKENYIEDICGALIDKMALLFLPAGVSMILYLDVIKAELLPISLTLVLSSLVILSSTALVLEILLRKKEKGGQQ
ncbi:MAG: CidA/LrgA family protein [Phascolarctobacterium sp.]|nr:CidA/LrgA family protein [Phascolarctobacterium sp.]MBQ7760281.1 CidA/LrgA family protein [Acidaminococcaceae bacterium]MBQ7883933.1 CidA/LrgA family protein [Phascolarctobacterium sp.]